MIALVHQNSQVLTLLNSILLHKIIALLALSIAANLDNLGVGIAYGMKKNRISATANFLIAVISAGLTYLAMVFGKFLEVLLPSESINILGAIIIISVGFWVYFEDQIKLIAIQIRHWLGSYLSFHFAKVPSEVAKINYKKNRDKILPRMPSFFNSRHRQKGQYLDIKETSILGFSLSLNAMAGGFGAALSGYNPVSTSLAIGLFSYLTIAVGDQVSNTYFKWLGVLAPKVAAVVLIIIGVYELFF